MLVSSTTIKGFGSGAFFEEIAVSPFDDSTWLVGIDPGLYITKNSGNDWKRISHYSNTFSSAGEYPRFINFCNHQNGTSIIEKDTNGYRYTVDDGDSWTYVKNYFNFESISYIIPNTTSYDCFFATNKGLFKSEDGGESFFKSSGIDQGYSVGTFFDHDDGKLYHATEDKIFVSVDGGNSFSEFYDPQFSTDQKIKSFSGGRTGNHVTLAFVDQNSSLECGNKINCGHIWIKKDDGNFTESETNPDFAGVYLRMAENDHQTLYFTGSHKNEWGTQILKSTDSGDSWTTIFEQLGEEDNYLSSLAVSGIGIALNYEVEKGYNTFTVSQTNSLLVAAGGYAFLHTTINGGNDWDSPYCAFNDSGDRKSKGKKWSSTGIEGSLYSNCEYHPKNNNFMYCQIKMDLYNEVIGFNVISEDNGFSWKYLNNKQLNPSENSNFLVFDETDDSIIYNSNGNTILRSIDKGETWTQFSKDSGDFSSNFKRIKYDSTNKILYGAINQKIAKTNDDGNSWEWIEGTPNDEFFEIKDMQLNPCTNDLFVLFSLSENNDQGIYYLEAESNIMQAIELPYSNFEVSFVTVNFNNSNEMYVFQIEYAGPREINYYLLHSENKGLNWTQIEFDQEITTLLIDPRNDNILHIVSNDQHFYSTDKGQNFSKENTDFDVYDVIFDKNDANKLFYIGNGLYHVDNPIKSDESIPSIEEFCQFSESKSFKYQFSLIAVFGVILFIF